MSSDSYLSWLIRRTPTRWWHDSAEPREIDEALRNGAVGVTTNPMLSSFAVVNNRDGWSDEIREVLTTAPDPDARAEGLLRLSVTRAARALVPEYERSGGGSGFVCGQVNPARPGDREGMLAMARRYRTWAPNIAVKLPATCAGLDVLEECIAEGITSTATVSFTVPQTIAIAERHLAGIRRAEAAGVEPGRCFAVIMIGRLDDFLREVAQDNRAPVEESDIRASGLAVTKRAYAMYRERGYRATLIVAAMRGLYHLTELAGADLIMSVATPFQESLRSPDLPKEERIDRAIATETLERLSVLPDFLRAYEPQGMKPEEFVSYGATQRTLAQFCEMGWSQLQRFRL